jgi:hypothetical protein
MRWSVSDGRLLTCVDCGEEIFVYEVPVPFCDPATFRCVFCLDPRHERAQLELVTGTPSPRSEVRNYDPAQAAFPY